MSLPSASIAPEPAVSQWRWPAKIMMLVDNSWREFDPEVVSNFAESFRRFLETPEAMAAEGADDDGADF